ncbi:hypothetical protein [Saccharopolyspora shandongensis]|uniref:hypothetical protein n=1 Tax=Saccharopolyspora shandongensis TaxID=418495 RepID=UPI0033CCE2B8
MINRDGFVDRITLMPKAEQQESLDPAEVPEHVLTSVEACTVAGMKALRSLGFTKDLVLQLCDRWYGVHVLAGYAEQAAEALKTAELHANTDALAELAQTLDTLAAHVVRALPQPSARAKRSGKRQATLRRERVASQRRELASRGSPPPFNICMFPLLGDEGDRGRLVLPATTPRLRRIVEKIGRQFRREGQYDVIPFESNDHRQHGILLLTSKFHTTFPIASGAAGFSKPDRWQLDWIWLHPYERGTGYLNNAWDELEDLFGLFLIDGPYSAAMNAIIRRRGIPKDRLTHPITQD